MIHNDQELFPWIRTKLSQRPMMELRDVYKLLYQGVLGPEHMIPSAQFFTRRLVEEFSAVEPVLSDPLCEEVRPDGRLLRVNLRPFKALSGDPAQLSAVCLETGRREWGTIRDLRLTWKRVLDACRSNELGEWSSDEMHEIEQLLESNSYSPLHHSYSYRQAYHPAYRLVASDLLRGRPFDTPS